MVDPFVQGHLMGLQKKKKKKKIHVSVGLISPLHFLLGLVVGTWLVKYVFLIRCKCMYAKRISLEILLKFYLPYGID